MCCALVRSDHVPQRDITKGADSPGPQRFDEMAVGLSLPRATDVIIAALRGLELSPDPNVSTTQIKDMCTVLLNGLRATEPPAPAPRRSVSAKRAPM
jgi:hypothetical protein